MGKLVTLSIHKANAAHRAKREHNQNKQEQADSILRAGKVKGEVEEENADQHCVIENEYFVQKKKRKEKIVRPLAIANSMCIRSSSGYLYISAKERPDMQTWRLGNSQDFT